MLLQTTVLVVGSLALIRIPMTFLSMAAVALFATVAGPGLIS